MIYIPQWVDVRKTKYAPESLIECVDQAAVTTGGEVVSRYVNSPFHTCIENMQIESTANMDVFLGVDGVAEKIQYRTNALVPISSVAGEDVWKWNKHIATKTLEVMYRMTAGGGANVYGRWNLTTYPPSILDKMRMKQKLTAEEQQIRDNLDLEDQLAVGHLRYPPSPIS